MRRLFAVVFFVAWLTAFGSELAAYSHAQDTGPHQADAAAIREAARQYLTAKRRGDAAAMAKMWTLHGDYVDATGRIFAAQEMFDNMTASGPTELDSAEIAPPKSSLRFITPDVAIEDGASSEISADGSVVSGRFTAVWRKRDGRWLLDGLRETGSSAPAIEGHLQPLEWLLGERAAAADDAVILESTQWSDDGNFIVRKFEVHGPNGGEVGGTQWIGWDPIAGEIKSWTQDSEGGNGEGTWRLEGKNWKVESTEVSADGAKAQTSCVYTPGANGSYIWESTRTTVDGKAVPASRVEFKRAAEDE